MYAYLNYSLQLLWLWSITTRAMWLYNKVDVHIQYVHAYIKYNCNMLLQFFKIVYTYLSYNHVLIPFPIAGLLKHGWDNIFYPGSAHSWQVWNGIHSNSRWFLYILLIPHNNIIPNSYLSMIHTGKYFLSKYGMLPAGLTWDTHKFQVILLYFTHTI